MNIHISFDFWNTIGRANTQFSTERVKLLSRMTGYPEENCKAAYFNIKRFVDAEAERCGYGPSCNEVHVMFMQKLTGRDYVDDAAVQRLMVAHNELANSLPPIIQEDMIDAYRSLKNSGQCTTSITSNTNYVMGRTLKAVLDRNGMEFDGYVFSDEFGHSKPHNAIWEIIQSTFNGSEVIHIGDNLICDKQGADDFGFKGILVSGVEETPKAIMNILDTILV